MRFCIFILSCAYCTSALVANKRIHGGPRPASSDLHYYYYYYYFKWRLEKNSPKIE